MSSDVLVEQVPRLVRRAGDAVLANENNATLILGRDRPGRVDSGYGSSAGSAAAHLVVGRRGSDPAPMDDAATVYLSARTDPDDLGGTGDVGGPSKGVPAIFLRADCVRVVPRKDLKLVVGGTSVLLQDRQAVLEALGILLGKAAVQPAILGTTYRGAEDIFFTALGILAAAIEAYAVAIQPVADISKAATPVLSTAIGVFQTALGVFQSGAPSYLSLKVKLE